jgi:hypothetical protein
MGTTMNRALYWAPRALCIVFAAFISIFAADVFGHGGGFWQTALALLIHLVPTFLVVAVLVASWRHEWIGGIVFVALGVLYVAFAWSRPFFGWAAFLAISAPLLLTGVLFLLNWRHRVALRVITHGG